MVKDIITYKTSRCEGFNHNLCGGENTLGVGGPDECIPVSETRYRSHFGDMDEIEAADSPQDYARMVVLVQLRGPSKVRATTTEDQLSLFS